MRSFPAGYYTGESSTWEVASVLLTEVRHSAAKSVDEHQHEASYFSLLLEGAYEERGEGFDLRYEPYTLVFHTRRTPHRDRMLGPCRFFAVDLLPRWETVIAELGGARAHVFELAGGDPVWLVLRLYREFLARADAGESGIEALIYELCAQVAPRSPEELLEPAWLAQADAAIREGFPGLSDLRQLAAALRVHPTHLCRVFRRFRGHTISDAAIGARVQYVARQLAESNEPLAEIAARAGFADQSHMTRMFKRITGSSPGDHRRISNP
ncbi:MAG TPA: helix-turn-helix transcriptional regulator [Candidatus Cybelea sp.]|jgi:AraC family transcriptional regulator